MESVFFRVNEVWSNEWIFLYEWQIPYCSEKQQAIFIDLGKYANIVKSKKAVLAGSGKSPNPALSWGAIWGGGGKIRRDKKPGI